ncbi:hypothetical protein ACOSP7_014171 [Xanthoceras sorbifolium]
MDADSLHSLLPSISGTHNKGSKMQSTSFLDFPSLVKTLNFNLINKLDTVGLGDLISNLKLLPSTFLLTESTSDLAIEPSINEAFLAWNQSNRLLLCWLLSTVSKSIIGQVYRSKSSLEFLPKLERLFSQ